MPVVHKVLNDDGSYTIMAQGRPVRSTHDSLEADEILRSLSYLEDDEDSAVRRDLYA